MTTLDVEGGARQLRRRFSEWKFGSQWAEALDEALAAERVATVERIRERLEKELMGALAMGINARVAVRDISAILDEEAARG